MSILLSIGLAMAAQGQSEQSPNMQTCNVDPRHKIVMQVAELPASIRDYLTENIPDLAARDRVFQRHDNVVHENLPLRRFVGGIDAGDMWVVVYERGITNSMHSVSFSKNMNNAFIPQSHLVGPLCAIIKSSIANVRAGNNDKF